MQLTHVQGLNMKLSRLSKLAITAAAAVAFAAPVSAVPIDVTFNVAALGAFVADTGDVTTATTITNGAPDVVGFVQSSNIGLVAGTPVSVVSGRDARYPRWSFSRKNSRPPRGPSSKP